MNKDNSNKYTYQLSDLERRITLARGEEMVDLIIKNTRIINVFSGEIHETDVAIADGIFIGLGNGYDAKYSYDAQGRYMCPGLIDGHIHIESTFLSPSEFCNVVAAHGTSAVICDPHEIANVLGPIGLDYFIQSTKNLPVKVYFMMPSCVPSTFMETSGSTILFTDIIDYLQRYPDRVIGLGEMMNYPGVVNKNKEILNKIIAVGSRPKDGHAPLLSGKSLDAYVIAGLGSDHECTSAKEAMEKLRRGMHIMIRQGTHEKNLQDLIVIINEFNSSHMSLVSDDRSPTDLKENGHIDYLIRSAISLGLTPIRAIQMGSINTARYFGLKNLGAIAPGFKADFILLDDLESFKISQIFLDGRRIENIGPNRTSTSNVNDKNFLLDFSFLRNTVHIKSLDNQNMFAIHTSSNDLSSTLIQVIGVIPGQIITHKRTLSVE